MLLLGTLDWFNVFYWYSERDCLVHKYRTKEDPPNSGLGWVFGGKLVASWADQGEFFFRIGDYCGSVAGSWALDLHDSVALTRLDLRRSDSSRVVETVRKYPGSGIVTMVDPDYHESLTCRNFLVNFEQGMEDLRNEPGQFLDRRVPRPALTNPLAHLKPTRTWRLRPCRPLE